MSTWWQVLLGGLFGSIVGGLIAGAAVVWQQRRMDRTATVQAFLALRFEFEQVREVEKASDALGILLIPTDAYRAALPHIGALSEEQRSNVLVAGLAIAAYNRNAARLIDVTGRMDESLHGGMMVMLYLAADRCEAAVASLDQVPGVGGRGQASFSKATSKNRRPKAPTPGKLKG